MVEIFAYPDYNTMKLKKIDRDHRVTNYDHGYILNCKGTNITVTFPDITYPIGTTIFVINSGTTIVNVIKPDGSTQTINPSGICRVYNDRQNHDLQFV